jgi:hypothetical protein
MAGTLEPTFSALRAILQRHRGALTVKADTPTHFSLEAAIGPTTLKAWGGKARKPTIPVAWVEIGKAYVSYHLMGAYGNTALQKAMSKELKARMQGKSCFNFTTPDPALLAELEKVTVQSMAAFKAAGFVS